MELEATVRYEHTAPPPIVSSLVVELPAPQPLASPDLADEEQKVLEFSAEVKAIASNIHRRLPKSVELDDLMQAGQLGLIDALRRYDPQRPLTLRQYARIRIAGAIIDSLREQDWASRYMRTRQQKLENVKHELQSRLGRDANSEELAQSLGMDLQSYFEFAAAIEEIQRVDNEDDDGDLTPHAIENVAADIQSQPDQLFFRQDARSFIARAMTGLGPDQRSVLELYYYREKTMSEIATALHRTESRISQIHAAALKRLSYLLAPEFGYEVPATPAGTKRRNRSCNPSAMIQ